MHPARPLFALAMLLPACAPDRDPVMTAATPGNATDTPDPSGDPDTDPSGAPTTGEPDPTGSPGAVNRELDILFVIDNSGSMAEQQKRLIAGFPKLAAVLEDPSDPFDYRIGFTTTDSGNPRCLGTSPESGDLVLSSCRDRVEAAEFEAQGTDYSSACTAACDRLDGDITVAATATEVDDQKSPRRWIERIGGASNVDLDLVDAFACYAPQGVAGCGFESPLESAYRAVAASRTETSTNNYGFIRASASLLVVIVSDEADCSANPAYGDIFSTNKVFWHDPQTDVAPTSSVCWRAGVACEGSSPYVTCDSEDYDSFGAPKADDASAVLWPVHKYSDFFQALADEKRGASPRAEVLVALVAGVPDGYETRSAEIVYKDSSDPYYQSLFGIGPGCFTGPSDAPTGTAVPPVREREFAETINNSEPEGDRLVYSICADDYSGSLTHLGARLRGD